MPLTPSFLSYARLFTLRCQLTYHIFAEAFNLLYVLIMLLLLLVFFCHHTAVTAGVHIKQTTVQTSDRTGTTVIINYFPHTHTSATCR